MASVSVSHMILFIASIIVAASVAGVFTNSISNVSQALDQRGVSVSHDVRTDIEIISDSGSSAVYNGSTNNVTLYVKNTGSQMLGADPDLLDVLVDGQYTTNVSVTVLGDHQTWGRGDVIRLEISSDHTLQSGDHRVKVIVNEDEEVFEFRT
ncbi:MAG: CARDB domain-containing protein [Haloarculaceae archaeon]